MRLRIDELRGEMTWEELAEKVGKDYSHLWRINRGQRRPSLALAVKIAEVLDVPIQDLYRDPAKTKPKVTLAPLTGHVGAGDQIVWLGDDPLDQIEAPPHDPPLQAVLVRGFSMDPVYRSGDIVFFAEQLSENDAWHRHDCVVELEDGRVYIKRLEKTKKRNRFKLISYNPNAQSMTETVKKAAPILWVKRK